MLELMEGLKFIVFPGCCLDGDEPGVVSGDTNVKVLVPVVFPFLFCWLEPCFVVGFCMVFCNANWDRDGQPLNSKKKG
jgi:hypothetical protein